MKETKKKDMRVKVLLMVGSTLGHLHKAGENNWDKLWDNDSGHNEGTICLVNSEWVAEEWFFERGRTNWCHLTRIGWCSGLVVLISSIVGLLILYS